MHGSRNLRLGSAMIATKEKGREHAQMAIAKTTSYCLLLFRLEILQFLAEVDSMFVTDPSTKSPYLSSGLTDSTELTLKERFCITNLSNRNRRRYCYFFFRER